MKTFNLPDLGEGLQDAEIVEWKVAEGDTVAVDDPLVAVETAKAVVDVPSPESGTITRLHAKNGDVVEVGKPLVDFDGEPAGDKEQPDDSADQADKPAEKSEKKAKAAPAGSGVVFNLPDLGEGLQDAEIVEWKVAEGDEVKVDDPLVAVETAKAVVDVPSPENGTIGKLHANNGDVVEVGKPLVTFGSAEGGGAKEEPADEPEAEREDAGSVVGKMTTSDEELTETAIVRKKRKKGGGTGKVKALPAVRRLAKELDVDLARVTPTGNKGQVTASDVEKAAASGPSRPQAASAGSAGMGFAGGMETPMAPPRDDVDYGVPQPLRGPRRAMHQSMSASRDQVAACTLFDDADIHYWQPGQDITGRIIRALVAGVRAEPGMNAWYDGEKRERILHEHVDVAMAVDTPDGLIVPVLRQVDQADAAGLRDKLNAVKQATRDRSVAPEDMKDPTITLSNFGMMAGRYATPVVVPPQVAILGTGGIRHDVVAVMGGMECHKRIPLSVTFDHRCLTGGEACRFLKAVIDDLQKPF
ncbi:pyruvate dehydrogenase E2 component (dihydrolipoamide acetyltransferase) [Natronospira proteinivora]|uniref:Dihydrolipoamide acetyltransferase component of pyruvate dehydrogenase complex n=1 Tax=Natronospira proteinivora TaxID=1807133 RepID=A0ABT1GB84_9GAMM|nr:2-oxo acid dehydrogenase subunit E2 [Natronospira proteinivora]MCP1727523.1 pyruvate dehydrogenase E2 component (dihydrolipoamide acetyltransferase) [Natronospira proteinivora]